MMSNHQCRQMIFSDALIGSVQQVACRVWIQGGSMLIKQQNVWSLERSHQKAQGLPLPAGECSGWRSHTIFQAIVHLRG